MDNNNLINNIKTKKTPYFVFKPKVLEKNYKEFKRLCKKYLEKYVIAYSVKTNSFEKVIENLDKLGSNFEVASLEEIELINKILNFDIITKGTGMNQLEIGKSQAEFSKEKQLTSTQYKNKLPINNKVTNNKQKLIVFNGPCKTEEELNFSIENKFLINVDSKSEIDKIAKILDGKKFDIGLRVSLEESKFGFEPERLEEIINYCKKNNLKIICLSFHEGTKLNINNYKKFIENIDKVIFSVKNKVELNCVDLGGGFPDNFQLKGSGVGLKDYFKLINKLKKFNLTIIFEPGRVLVSDAFNLITKIKVIKQNFGKNYVILDAGINVLSKIALANYKFSKMNIDNAKLDKDRVVNQAVQSKKYNNYPSNDNINNDIYEKGTEDQTREMNKQLSESSSSSLLSDNINIESKNIKNKNNSKGYILAGPLLFKNDILGKFFGNLKEKDLIKIENVGAYCYNLAWEISYKKPKILIEE